MYNMMNTTGQHSGLALFYGLHMLGASVAIFGGAMLLMWAFKYLKEGALWKWGWILLVVGSFVCLLSFPAWPFFGGMMGNINGNLGGYDMMQ